PNPNPPPKYTRAPAQTLSHSPTPLTSLSVSPRRHGGSRAPRRRRRRRRPPPAASHGLPARRSCLVGHGAAGRATARQRRPAVPREPAAARRCGGVPERHGAHPVPPQRQVRGGGVVPPRRARPGHRLHRRRPLRRRAAPHRRAQGHPRLPRHRGRRRARVPGGGSHQGDHPVHGRVPPPRDRPQRRRVRRGDGRRHGHPPRPPLRPLRQQRQLPPRLLHPPPHHRLRRRRHQLETTESVADVQLQASMLAVEAGQDAVIRMMLYERADEVVAPYKGRTVAEFTRRISEWRNAASRCGAKDEGVKVLDRRQGAERRTVSNILGAGDDSLGFARTPAEVLRILYGSGNEQVPGGFLPRGGNGTIARGFFQLA
ncbi:hypothetical protein EE612_027143, partial [Oryza sativa]